MVWGQNLRFHVPFHMLLPLVVFITSWPFTCVSALGYDLDLAKFPKSMMPLDRRFPCFGTTDRRLLVGFILQGLAHSLDSIQRSHGNLGGSGYDWKTHWAIGVHPHRGGCVPVVPIPRGQREGRVERVFVECVDRDVLRRRCLCLTPTSGEVQSRELSVRSISCRCNGQV